MSQPSRPPGGSPGDSGSQRPLAQSRFSQAEAVEADEADRDDDELPLDESMAVAKQRPKPAVAPPPVRPAEERRRAQLEPEDEEAGRPARRKKRRAQDEAAARPAAAAPSAPALVPISAEQMRHLIGEQPDLLEPGLRVLGEEGRRHVGIGYGTEVGEIDLLGRSASGDWVVVMVADGGNGQQVVSEVLRRVGWVRKHMCEDDEAVRAIVLLESLDAELGYAAAAVAHTVSFRTWRISVVFEPIEI